MTDVKKGGPFSIWLEIISEGLNSLYPSSEIYYTNLNCGFGCGVFLKKCTHTYQFFVLLYGLVKVKFMHTDQEYSTASEATILFLQWH